MENMGQDMTRNKDELDAVRSRSSGDDAEKQEWQATQRDLEAQLQAALDLNDTLQQDMDRIRSEQSAEERQLRAQIDELRQSQADEAARGGAGGGGANDAELARENENLRQALREQQRVTEEVRGEAQKFLREMRMLSQQSGSSYEKHAELEKTIETLEAEVREWRNRYARSKTQQRSMRASSMGVPIEEDAGRYVREQGFTTDSGLVKDVHVTKFQIAVDELLRRARTEAPERAVDSMKAVVASVRRITKDMDDAMAQQQDSDAAEHLSKLKTRVSGTANNLITAAKNYAMSAGLSPVSLLDAAASHLVASVVELLRTVKIRTTPANELEEDDEGSITPVESNASFFSPRSNGQTPATTYSSVTHNNALPPPPPFQGLGGHRDSGDSSAYSPISSPRESVDRFGGGYANGRANGVNGMNGMNGSYGMNGMNKAIPAALNVNGNMNGNSFGPPSPVPGRADERTEDLKALLDDQTATMVQIIQDMVGSIRSDAPVQQITGQINSIANIVGKVLAETEASGNGGPSLDKLASCRQRLVDAGERGEQMYAAEASGGRKMDMRSWTTSLPPIAFEIARETKELVKRIDRLVLGDGDDFS